MSEVIDFGGRVDAIVIDFAKAFDVVPHDILILKLIDAKIDRRVIAWISEFLRDRNQKVRIGQHLSEKGNITSGVPQGSVIGPLLFLIFVNDISQNITSKIRLFADDCILYREITEQHDMIQLQEDLNKINDWARANKMTVNGNKSKAITFCRARDFHTLPYQLGNDVVPRVSNCKYLGILLDSKLGWEKQTNYVVGKAWRSLHFVMRNLKKCNTKAKEIAYTSLVRPVMEYGASCWDPYRIGLKKSLERIQNRAAKYTFRKNIPARWESLEHRRKRARLCVMYKSYTGGSAWQEIRGRLDKPDYFNRFDHKYKIRTRIQRTDVGKFSFVNRTIVDWNDLPATVFEPFPCSARGFRKKV